jgi:hypothetical protein
MRERIRIHRSKSTSVEHETPKLQQFSETLDRGGEARSGAQAPITVSEPTDHAEIEADAAADALK